MTNPTLATNTKRHLPRLQPAHYQGFAIVFWTHTLEDRATGWLTDAFLHQFRELLLHTCGRYGLFCPAYCLMPDHMHLVWVGVTASSDQLMASRFLRKHMRILLLPRKLQPQAHDHVLHEEERERGAFQSTCHYVFENPVRKQLADQWSDYPYTGCMVPGYPELQVCASDFWDRFWRIYEYVRRRP